MTTKKLCINAMGIALFVVLALCVQAPVFENYYLCLGYVVLLYSLPFLLRVANNIYAFVADVIVLVIGFEICITGEKVLKRMI